MLIKKADIAHVLATSFCVRQFSCVVNSSFHQKLLFKKWQRKRNGFSQLNLWNIIVSRCGRSQMFFKISVLKRFANFTGKHLCWSLFLIKLQALRPATLLKKDSNTGVYLWNLRIFNNTFFKEHFQWLFLYVLYYSNYQYLQADIENSRWETMRKVLRMNLLFPFWEKCLKFKY